MGCDIHIIYERQAADGTFWPVDMSGYRTGPYLELPFSERSYSLFAFFAGVRNYSNIKPIAEIRGLPYESHDWKRDRDLHSHSWLSIKELSQFDYDAMLVDERCGDVVESYREYLGENFFVELANCRAAGVDRILFCFDC